MSKVNIWNNVVICILKDVIAPVEACFVTRRGGMKKNANRTGSAISTVTIYLIHKTNRQCNHIISFCFIIHLLLCIFIPEDERNSKITADLREPSWSMVMLFSVLPIFQQLFAGMGKEADRCSSATDCFFLWYSAGPATYSRLGLGFGSLPSSSLRAALSASDHLARLSASLPSCSPWHWNAFPAAREGDSTAVSRPQGFVFPSPQGTQRPVWPLSTLLAFLPSCHSLHYILWKKSTGSSVSFSALLLNAHGCLQPEIFTSPEPATV